MVIDNIGEVGVIVLIGVGYITSSRLPNVILVTIYMFKFQYRTIIKYKTVLAL